MPKKAFAIYPRTKEATRFGLETSFGRIRWGKKGVINTHNKGLVDEINERYGQKYGGHAYSVQDDILAKAVDGEVWDIQKTEKGDVVKPLHNYTFAVRKPTPPTLLDKLKKFVVKHRLPFWYWDVTNPYSKKREIGIRVFGWEFVREIDGYKW